MITSERVWFLSVWNLGWHPPYKASMLVRRSWNTIIFQTGWHFSSASRLIFSDDNIYKNMTWSSKSKKFSYQTESQTIHQCAFGEYFLEILWSSCENFRLLAEAKCHAVLENKSKKLWNLLHTQNFYIIVSEPISKGAECPQVSYRTDSFGYTWPMTSFIYCSTGCCGARDNQFCCDEKPHM